MRFSNPDFSFHMTFRSQPSQLLCKCAYLDKGGRGSSFLSKKPGSPVLGRLLEEHISRVFFLASPSQRYLIEKLRKIHELGSSSSPMPDECATIHTELLSVIRVWQRLNSGKRIYLSACHIAGSKSARGIGLYPFSFHLYRSQFTFRPRRCAS